MVAAWGAERLADRAVHVWLVAPEQITDPALLDHYEGLMNAEERARRARFKFARNRHEYLVSRALVRTTLSRYLASPPTAWEFATNPYGRPEISAPIGPRTLRFNLSHTRGLAAVAVCWEHDMGVDVETTERRNATTAIARRFFSRSEVADLEQLPPDEQRRTFFHYWTLKEAYIKARGMGLAIPLEHFSFKLSAHEPVRISFAAALNDDPSAWQFEQFSPTPQHRLAIALRRPGGDYPIEIRWCVPGATERLSEPPG